MGRDGNEHCRRPVIGLTFWGVGYVARLPLVLSRPFLNGRLSRWALLLVAWLDRLPSWRDAAYPCWCENKRLVAEKPSSTSKRI